jgi:hypothetical protein
MDSPMRLVKKGSWKEATHKSRTTRYMKEHFNSKDQKETPRQAAGKEEKWEMNVPTWLELRTLIVIVKNSPSVRRVAFAVR